MASCGVMTNLVVSASWVVTASDVGDKLCCDGDVVMTSCVLTVSDVVMAGKRVVAAGDVVTASGVVRATGL